MVLFKDSSNEFFPLVVPIASYYHLEHIYEDEMHQENYFVDIIYKIDKPKSLFIEKNEIGFSYYYISEKDIKRKLNLIDILTISIRYNLSINLDIFLTDEINYFTDAPTNVDLYRLGNIDFENFKH
jgi:hypothetical protein